MKRMSTFAALVVAAAVSSASPAIAKDKQEKSYVVVNESVGVPVFPYDITDRPYTVIGEVKAGVRKATIFSKEASQEKVYRELWERGEKMGADAIINAKYGDSHVSAFSWGKTNATGTAIKFVAAAPGATPAAEPAVQVQAAPPGTAATADAAPTTPATEPAAQVQAAPAVDAAVAAETTPAAPAAEAADTTSVEASSEASAEMPAEQVDSAAGASVEAAPAKAPAADAETEPTDPAVTPN